MTKEFIRAAQDAIIYLKNGNRKHGILIDAGAKDNYHFISNVNYEQFKEDNNEKHIEIVPSMLVENIEIDLK
jgi:hypothetical protein